MPGNSFLRAVAGALCLIALGSCGGAPCPVARITVSAAGSGRPAAGYPGLGLLVEPLAPLGEADAGGEMTISLRDGAGSVRLELRDRPPKWRVGEPLFRPLVGPSAAAVPPGTYTLTVELRDPAGRRRPVVVAGAPAAARESVRVEVRLRAWDEAAAEAMAPARGANVILISIDTLRADHLGCYGYPRPTSPQIDRLHRDGVLFSQAIAQAPSTLVSHASIFSSRLPSHHGASFSQKTALPGEVLTVAEVLQEAGYRTAAFVGGGQLAPEFGLDQGFEDYQVIRGPTARTVRTAIRWLRDHPGERFFLFLHSFEVHHPYTPGEAYLRLFDDGYSGPLPRHVSKDLLGRINRGEVAADDRDRRHVVATYDAEIRSMDDAVGRLMSQLRANGLYDDALIVFTSDHGEEFGEHGWMGWHSHTLRDELLRVPLIIKLPGSRRAGTRVAAQVRGIDVAPTILAALGFAVPDEFAGLSLRPWMAGFRSSLPAVSQQDAALRNDNIALRTPEWKLYPNLLHHREEVRRDPAAAGRLTMRIDRALRAYRLFHLPGDPGERRSVEGEHRRTLRELRSLLEGIVAARERPPAAPVRPESETVEQLRALGYVE